MKLAEELELKELFSAVLNVETEEEQDAILSRISDLSPDPGWSNYIFQTDDYLDENQELDVDRLIEKIKSYRPIIL